MAMFQLGSVKKTQAQKVEATYPGCTLTPLVIPDLVLGLPFSSAKGHSDHATHFPRKEAKFQ